MCCNYTPRYIRNTGNAFGHILMYSLGSVFKSCPVSPVSIFSFAVLPFFKFFRCHVPAQLLCAADQNKF